jgi:hypothetical protein
MCLDKIIISGKELSEKLNQCYTFHAYTGLNRNKQRERKKGKEGRREGGTNRGRERGRERTYRKEGGKKEIS